MSSHLFKKNIRHFLAGVTHTATSGSTLEKATLNKMSKPDVDSDGFQKVKKRNTTKHNTKLKHLNVEIEKDKVVDVVKTIERLRCCVEELRLSNYSEDVIKSVSSILEDRKVVEIYCLGLGHVAECHISRYQLALLLCLNDHFNPEKVLVYDPLFYNRECEILTKLQLEVLNENSEGCYAISNKGPTIVFFPHCSKQLTNSFLWSNWGPNLHNCILICNSFNNLADSQPSRLLSDSVPFIAKILPHTSEQPLNNNFKFTDCFNDTSIHTFPKDNLEALDSDFWTKGEQPTYENIEEFITNNALQNLKI